MSGSVPLPGVEIVVSDPGGAMRATSTDTAGRYDVATSASAGQLTATLTGFDTVTHAVTLSPDRCDAQVDLQMTLTPAVAPAAKTAASETSATAKEGAAAPTVPGPTSFHAPRMPPRGFETLAVRRGSDTSATAPTTTDAESDAAARQMLPPGFGTDDTSQAVTVSGSMARTDRGMMNDRFDAIGRGEFDPATGEFGRGFGPGERGFGQGGGTGFGGPQGGPGMPGGMGPGGGGPPGGGFGGGGPGGFGGFGGRGMRSAQNRIGLTSNYTFGGSLLDAAPFQLHASSPAESTPYTTQSFGATVGGPLKIPGLYDGTRRTQFIVTYAGSRGGTLFDQYATVPTAAMRAGDFSALSTTLVDPMTGAPLEGNRIPAPRISPSASELLRFVPLPNVEGTARNYHRVDTANSLSDTVRLRVTHRLFGSSSNARFGGRGGGLRFGGGTDGPGGLAPGAPPDQPGPSPTSSSRTNRQRDSEGTSASLSAQFMYRRNRSDQLDVFPLLGGEAAGSSLAAPISLTIVAGRTIHSILLNVSRTKSRTTNQYSGVEDVAGDAGITGVSTDPFGWGVPSLAFASLSGLSDLTPSERTDSRVSLGYTVSRSVGTHLVRAGLATRWDRSSSRLDANATGSYVFTGLYSSGGARVPGLGADVADFLFGDAQQASVQYGPGTVRLDGRSFDAFAMDDWRLRSNLTINAGLRYELMWPYVERDGRMVNLDVNQDFTAAVPVLSGGTGPFSGSYSAALVPLDMNNLAPRVGVAWRFADRTVLRGGYGIGYHFGSYASLARQLTAQPPFATTSTLVAGLSGPLDFTDALAGAPVDEVTNNFGVSPDYVLGLVQTWNVDLSRDLRQSWNVRVGYVHARGSSLDMVRAPNRGPDGLRIEGVQPFLWQTSEGESRLDAMTVRARRRPVKGLGFGVTYTLGRSRDNAPSIGGGTAVAQNDQDLAAEWARSSFDRTHQITADVLAELPFGPDRRWLHEGGLFAALLEGWRATAIVTWQSGNPLTPVVRSAVSDAATGANGSLRADYSGGPIALGDPAVDRFFNTSVFSVPVAGTFGSAGRNIIVGPSSRLVNASLSRDLRMGGNRVATVQINATNLFNIVNYEAVDTVVNSPTFGQVLAVRPMRSVQLALRFRM